MPDVGAVRAGLAKRVPSPVKPPIPKKTAAPAVRGVGSLGEPKGAAHYQPPPTLRNVYAGARSSNPFSLINPRVATQLRAAGVTVVADKPTAAMRGRGYVAPPAAAFDAKTNAIRYNPLAAGWQGSLQHEFRHAAASNIHPIKLGSIDPRMGVQYAVGQTVRGRAAANLPFMLTKFVSPSLGKLGPDGFSLYDKWAEGFADRSGAYNVPHWGFRASNYIVPQPR
jgi:hypothetical protein